mgnify:CR=1 FL=1
MRLLKTGDLTTIILPVVLLERVCNEFDAKGVIYQVDDETLAVNDQPEVAFIDLSSRKNDAKEIEAILDGI